jgi:hypothetical protein
VRRRAGAAALLALALGAAGRARAEDAPPDLVARARALLAEDAADLRRFAEWAERAGLERTALAEWERVLARVPDDAVARKRLAYVKRAGAWVRDAASFALLAPAVDSKPAAARDAAARRREDVERPSGARHRLLAAKAFAAGARALGTAQLRLAVEADASDAWSRVALGLVVDPADGWVDPFLAERRAGRLRADADAQRLAAARTEPTVLAEPASRGPAAGTGLSVWRLREWRLETDLPAADAAEALAAADLAGRWFRETFGLDPASRVLPGEGLFVVLSTEDAYRRVIAAEPSLAPAERTFAASLGAYPLKHAADAGPWVVVAQRPDGPNAADVCLHYAVHLLAQARFRVEAQEAWLYEGLAAYAAATLLGFHGSWCIRLEDTSAHPELHVPDDPSEWPGLVEILVRLGDDFPLRGLVGVSINGLDPAMLAKSWSLVRWLLEEHRDEALAFFESKREGRPTNVALRAATGLPLDVLDEAWRAAVVRVGPE